LCRLARRCGKTRKTKSKPQTRQASHWQASLEDSASKPTRSAGQNGTGASRERRMSHPEHSDLPAKPACLPIPSACLPAACLPLRGLLFVISDLPTKPACLPAAYSLLSLTCRPVGLPARGLPADPISSPADAIGLLADAVGWPVRSYGTHAVDEGISRGARSRAIRQARSRLQYWAGCMSM
jgi:hypothetical protein